MTRSKNGDPKRIQRNVSVSADLDTRMRASAIGNWNDAASQAFEALLAEEQEFLQWKAEKTAALVKDQQIIEDAKTATEE